MYQDLYEKAIMIVKRDANIKFCDAARPLFLDTDASGISLGTRLLHVRDGMNYRHSKAQDNAIF